MWLWVYLIGFVVCLPAFYMSMATGIEKICGKQLEWNGDRFVAALMVSVVWPLWILLIIVLKIVR